MRIIIIITILLLLKGYCFANEEKPTQEDAYFQQSIIYEAKGEIDKAIFLMYNLKSYKAFLRLGWLYYLKGDYEKAEEFYSKALKEYPVEAKSGLAWIYLKKGKRKEANTLFEELLIQKPLDENIQLGLQLTSYTYKTTYYAIDVFYTVLKYHNSPYRKDGYVTTLTPKFTYKRITFSPGFIQTKINFKEPLQDIEQDEINIGFSYTGDKHIITFHYDHISNNHELTDGGNIFCAQIGYGKELFIGIEGSYSNYNQLDVIQVAPILRCSLFEKIHSKTKGYYITTRESRTTSNTTAIEQEFTFSPLKDLSFVLKGWVGEKSFPVEGAGTVIYNLEGKFKGGYGVSCLWNMSSYSWLFFSFSENRLTTSDIDYDSQTLTCGLGLYW